MLGAQLTFLSPGGALVALVALVPLGAVAYAARRGARTAAGLGLRPASARSYVPAALGAALACVLLGLAAAQPVLRTTESRLARTESQVVFVVDVSRSMLASSGPDSATRLDRARDAVSRLRAAVPDVPAGVSGLTDRVLPYAFPTLGAATFEDTVSRSVTVEAPPPQQVDTVATSFDALSALPRAGFFDPRATHRTCVLVSDGESRPFSAGTVGRALAGPRGCRLVIVRIGGPDERVFGRAGRPEGLYRPDAAARDKVERLAAAAGGTAYDEAGLGDAAEAVRTAAERGPTERAGTTAAAHALAPYLAGLALALVLLVVGARIATATLRKETRVSYHPSLQQ